MNIVSKLSEWQNIRSSLSDKKIGFVPTMGNLHAGHLNLCARAKTENDVAVASIFVNPTQFNDQQDFTCYPRTLEQDIKLLTANKIDYLFVPNADEMYPDRYQFRVIESELSKELEGEYRPGHFDGMLTIVLKLLNAVQPMKAYFGEKDYQQLLLVKKMVAALFLPVEIVGCPTVRAEDGLALSSRNSRLTTEQRQLAREFPRILMSQLKLPEMTEQLQSLGFKVDYIAEKWGRRLGAVWLGEVRLIDNI